MKKLSLCSLLFLLSGGPVFAATSGELDFFDFERASLEDILNINTGVASRLDSPAREAPGIVTVITREEILNSGARNLIDVLRLVPGLDFGVDVESTLGLGVRGNWAYEGKILVLVDGQQYNEPFMGSVQLQRIAPEQVERIEIIRGAGSAVYGGFAELGVIKITTRGAKDINGTEAALGYGYMSKTYGDRTADLALGETMGTSSYSAQFHYADGNLSDRRYTDFNGGSYSMADASGIHSRNLNIDLKKEALDIRLIADQYRTMQQDGYLTGILPDPLARNYDAYFAEVSRAVKLGGAVTITPSFNFRYMEPFNGYDAAYYPRDKSSYSYKGTVLADYSVSDRAKLSGGVELSQEKARLSDTTPMWLNGQFLYFPNGKKNIEYDNRAVFMEGLMEYSFGIFSAGARYDKNEGFNAAFSPRLAWTKVFDRLNLKAIYSGSFRAPGIDNLTANPALEPEKTTDIEFEAGYKLREDVFLSANVYDIRIKDPIVFYVNNSNQQYGNYGHTGTKGFELLLRLKNNWGYSDFSYSYYAAQENAVAFYNAGANSSTLLAFPRNKLTVNSSVKLAQDLSVNPSAVYYAGRRGFYAAGQVRDFNNILLANVNFVLKNLLNGRMEAGLGVFDLFGSGYAYIQPYDGGHAPLPGPSREIRGRLSYKF